MGFYALLISLSSGRRFHYSQNPALMHQLKPLSKSSGQLLAAASAHDDFLANGELWQRGKAFMRTLFNLRPRPNGPNDALQRVSPGSHGLVTAKIGGGFDASFLRDLNAPAAL